MTSTDPSPTRPPLGAFSRLEQRFRLAAESTGAFVYERVFGTDVLHWHGDINEALGYAPGELMRTYSGWQSIIHPDDRAAVTAEADARTSASEPFSLQYRVLHRDGSVRYWFDRGAVVLDSDGSPVAVVGACVDVTAERQAVGALSERERQFRAVFTESLDGMVIIDDDQRYVEVNPAAERLFGRARAELLGHRIGSFSRSRDGAALLFDELMAQGELKSEFTWETQDGQQRILDISARSDMLPGRHLVFLRDITAQREMEAQLRQAQKLEAIGLLAGGVAHDFNNLLSVMLGYGELLQDDLRTNPSAQASLEEILHAARRATALTRQLLAFSRRQVLQPRLIDLNRVVRDTETMLRRLIGEDITLEVQLGEALAKVRADPGQIEQVIVNLAVNARDAMPRGGRLTITTSMVREPARTHVGGADAEAVVGQGVRNASFGEPAHVLLTVTDTGVGMDANTLSRIFEPFFTTKPSGRGTGLGLPTAYGIVEQSGGSIVADSVPGHGTTIRVTLPIVHDTERPSSTTPKANLILGSGQTVLVVEDEPAVAALVRRMLSTLGYSVLSTGSVDEAMARLAAHDGSVDVVLTDVVMPGGSGRDLADRLATERPSLPVVFMSGYTADMLARHGGVEDGIAFLEKPFTADALAVAIHRALSRASSES